MGYILAVSYTGTQLGGKDLRDSGDVVAVVSALLGHAEELGAAAIFGVFAAPILAQLARTAQDAVQKGKWDGLPCYAAWNIMRSTEGSKPTFEHQQWLAIGHISQAVEKEGSESIREAGILGSLRWAVTPEPRDRLHERARSLELRSSDPIWLLSNPDGTEDTLL